MYFIIFGLSVCGATLIWKILKWTKVQITPTPKSNSTKMDGINIFLGTRSKCTEFVKEPLEEVAIDVLKIKEKSFLVLHDYFSSFLIIEQLKAMRWSDVIVAEDEVNELLKKYFLDIFERKPNLIKSDNGQNEYTEFVIKFCNKMEILHYFPVKETMPGISKITLQSLRVLFADCDNSYTEVQIAIDAMRRKKLHEGYSPNHLMFYKDKIFKWGEEHKAHGLDMSYAQLSLMKSKLEQSILSFNNALRISNKNSINFQSDYPCLVNSIDIKTLVVENFEQGFLNLLSKVQVKDTQMASTLLDELNGGKENVIKKKNKDQVINCEKPSSANKNSTQKQDLLKCKTTLKAKEKVNKNENSSMTTVNPSTEAWNVNNEQCFWCKEFGGHHTPTCVNKRPTTFCGHMNCFGQCRLSSATKEIIANLEGQEKLNAMRKAWVCFKCGRSLNKCTNVKQCPAITAFCPICNKIGHYGQLCLSNKLQ